MSRRTLFVYLLVASATFAAQSSASRQEGKLITSGSADSLWIELYETPARLMVDRVPVSRDGTFVVNVIPTSFYEVRVVTSHGVRITSDHVQFRQGQPVEIRLPASRSEAPNPAGPISVRRLSHKPAKPVRRLMREADSFADKGNLQASTETLERLLAADPDWFEAWNNLGARRLTIGRHAEAAEAFTQALRIDPNNAGALTNLGLTKLFLRQPADAERAAIGAEKIAPGTPRTAYVYGLALLQQQKQPAIALEALRHAATLIPRALLASAEWHCRHDDLAACEKDLRAFLRTPPGPNHANAEKWLALLTQNRPQH